MEEFEYQVNKILKEGELLLEASNNTERALSKFSEALTLDPNNYVALSKIAYCYLLEDKNEKAINTAKKSLEINPNYPYTLHIIGNTYLNYPDPLKKKYLKTAHKYFKKALELNPNDDYSISKIAFIEQRQNKIYKAYKRAQNALEINPNNEMAHQVIGWHYLMKYERNYEFKDLEKVHSHFLKALELEPEDSYVKYNYGIVCLTLAKTNEGYELLKEAVRQDPNSPLYQEYFKEAYIYNHKYYWPARIFFQQNIPYTAIGLILYIFFDILVNGFMAGSFSKIFYDDTMAAIFFNDIGKFILLIILILIYRKIMHVIIGFKYDKAFKEGTLSKII